MRGQKTSVFFTTVLSDRQGAHPARGQPEEDFRDNSRPNFLLSRDARLEVESNLARIRGSIADSSHQLEKSRAVQKVFAEGCRRSACQELVETVSKRNSAAEELEKAEFGRQLIVRRAPADAVVLEIASRTVGSVVREAETLFVLVRRDVQLQPEVNEGKASANWRPGSRYESNSRHFHSGNTARRPVRFGSQARTRSRQIRRPKVRATRPVPITACRSTCGTRIFGCRRNAFSSRPGRMTMVH